MLCDTSPLVALVSRRDPAHPRCLDAISGIPGPLVTTMPCRTEAMHVIYRYDGWPGRKAIWEFVRNGFLVIRRHDDGELTRMEVLMERYQDRPMDMADASLVAAAETLNQRTIFTLDSDFYVYRFRDTGSFQIVPE